MWPGFFFFFFANVFFPDSTKHFSYTCSDKTEEKSFVFLGDHPYSPCSLHLSTLLVTRTVLYRAALSSCSVWVRRLREHDQ